MVSTFMFCLTSRNHLSNLWSLFCYLRGSTSKNNDVLTVWTLRMSRDLKTLVGIGDTKEPCVIQDSTILRETSISCKKNIFSHVQTAFPDLEKQQETHRKNETMGFWNEKSDQFFFETVWTNKNRKGHFWVLLKHLHKARGIKWKRKKTWMGWS